ncbi:carbohydrate ABC transporter membrane protein 1 (CUT1 family) [Planifilum fimeticola]|uniref:Carbohydrate ABC transporter membrane protein 1 (CUT1 family) n=1 Tax=Planifilum fimeticola TaxID=201975 RepID=A0A2T0LGS2_9BACL|nr:sugar ABC transporter permease [Planifilum fimeticola]PRX41507.1 carbohydrate ABC transporter membrane protein 1 (CUT1 family) [Planifilum fimeticola]
MAEIQTVMRRVRFHRKSRMETPLQRNLAAYTFLIPWLTGMMFLTLGAMLFTFYLAFTDYDLISSPEWVGLENFRQIFRDPNFWASIRATFTYVVFSVPARLVVSLLIALLLYKEVRGIGWYRAFIYLPSLIGTSVGAAIGWRNLFAEDGPINSFLGLFGIEGPNWVGNPSTAIVVLILLSVWQFGSEMVIFLAGLKQIPGYLYEAAIIDGASAMQRFFKITLPMLSPITFFNLLMGTISSFMIFTQVYIITGGGPMKSTLMYVYYLYQQAFTYYNMGYAAALSIILLIIIGLCSAAIFLSSRLWVNYDV